ncbi:MAG: NfeD family protein [Aquabacterium sp.]|uniref:NfeD family protein n=1 Tax=Aquabacterium sp. TaxID=1872578 RepID=UPI003BC98130
MSEATLWWVITGVLVGLELVSGTFYLLMLALGSAAAALSTLAQASTTVQLIVAAVVGGAAVLLWHRKQSQQRAASTPPGSSVDPMKMDVGAKVDVKHWHADGTAQVHYRGSVWMARHRGDQSPQPGLHHIHAVEGNHLILEKD